MRYEIASTAVFDKWLRGLKDRPSKNKILTRLARIENGNLGDFRQLDEKLFELRFFFGPGLRIYYTIRNGSGYITADRRRQIAPGKGYRESTPDD